MPRKDGFQTCKDIRAWEAKQIEAGTARGNVPIPIVALSAYVMSDMVDKCRESGFTKYLSKPVVFQKLKGMIRIIFFFEVLVSNCWFRCNFGIVRSLWRKAKRRAATGRTNSIVVIIYSKSRSFITSCVITSSIIVDASTTAPTTITRRQWKYHL